MYLYSKNKDKIEIYTLEPNIERFHTYKEEQMKLIKDENRFLRAETNSKKILEQNNSIVSYWELKSGKINYGYHDLLKYDLTTDEKERQQTLLQKYYKTTSNYGKLIKVTEHESIKFLLLTNSNYIKEKPFLENTYQMNDIINLPEALYNLELFISEKVDDVNNDYLKDIVNLYSYSNPVTEFSYNQIKSFENYNLIPNATNYVDSKIEQHEKILKLINKK